MDFETQNKPQVPEKEKYSGADRLQPEAEAKIECPERQEVVDRAILELKVAFKTLSIDNWTLPEVKIKFVESVGGVVLGRVEVHDGSVEIIYDQRFSSAESEAILVEELRKSGIAYPGMLRTLIHELAHVAMWSVTGLQRQPATRLVDEGWATLLENTGGSFPIASSKSAVQQGLSDEPDLFHRCLDFSKPVTFEENLNAAEYTMGQALLLWVYEKFGKAKMIELIQKSPSPERRNDNLPQGEFEPALVDKNLHTTAPEYINVIKDVKFGKITAEEARIRVKEWEGRQFEVALLEVMRVQNLEEVRQEFLKWIND